MKGLKESTVGKMAGASPFRRTSRRLLLVASALAVTLIIVLFHKSASANTEAWTAEMTVGSNDQLNFTKVGFLNIPDDLDGGSGTRPAAWTTRLSPTRARIVVVQRLRPLI